MSHGAALLLRLHRRPEEPHVLRRARDGEDEGEVDKLMNELQSCGVLRAANIKGRLRFVLLEAVRQFADERFGPNRKAEDLVGAFNNRALNASVFPNLAGLSPFVVGA